MTRRRFGDPLPERLTFDTNFLVDLVVSTQGRHDLCAAFFERVVQQRPEIPCAVSALVYPEFENAVARLYFISDLGLGEDDAQKRLRERGPGDVAQQVQTAVDTLEDVLSYPEEMFQVPLDIDRWREALALSLRFSLQPYDAIHAAAAFRFRSSDIVSFDSSFDRVPGLSRWS